MQRTESKAELALYGVQFGISVFMTAVTTMIAIHGDRIGFPFAAIFLGIAIVIGWFGRSYAIELQSRMVRVVRHNWRGMVLVLIGGAALAVLYLAFNFVGLFTETQEFRTKRETSDQDLVSYRQYVDACAKKNDKKHFAPMIGFSPIVDECGFDGRYNGVVCTENSEFQSRLKKLWDDARARNACIIYEDTAVRYKGSTRQNRGIVAYGDDRRDSPIYLGLRGKK